MERNAFQLLHDAESSWWYRGRSLVVSRVLKHFTRGREGSVLDLGAGWGGMFSVLSPYGDVTALEPDTISRDSCTARGYKHVLSANDSSTLGDEIYSLIAFFDVLEHTEDDAAFLADVHRSLVKGGSIILTVPAFQFLWSAHDVEHHHYRRYHKSELVSLIEKAGFSVAYVSYWNILLFPFALLVRKSGHSGASSLTMSGWLDTLFYAVVRTESKLIPLLSLPLGTGLIIYASKKS